MSLEKTKAGGFLIDRFAISLSGICLVHCLAIPLALVLLPVFGAGLRSSETAFHWLLFGVAAPVSGVALVLGYRHHKRATALLLGAAGLATMALGASPLAHAAWEEALTILGVGVLTVAHVANIRSRATPAGH